jgi:hypothetical protein
LRGSISQAFDGVCFKVEEYYRHNIAGILLFWQDGPDEIDVKKYLHTHGYPISGPIKVIFHHGEYVNTHYGYQPVTERKEEMRRQFRPAHTTQTQLHPIDAMTIARLRESRRLQNSLKRTIQRKGRAHSFLARIIKVSREQMEMFTSGENKVNYQTKLSY